MHKSNMERERMTSGAKCEWAPFANSSLEVERERMMAVVQKGKIWRALERIFVSGFKRMYTVIIFWFGGASNDTNHYSAS
jgi:hypothetical protein